MPALFSVQRHMLAVADYQPVPSRASPTPTWLRYRASRQHLRSRNEDPRGRQQTCSRIRAAQSSSLLINTQVPQSRRFTAAGWLATFSIAAVVLLFLYQFVGSFRRRKASASEAELEEAAQEADGYESEAYKTVLASVRQNIVFQRALQSMREGNTVRAMVELHRVLEHNAVCRKPLNLEYYKGTDLEDIYRLHLQNSELPLQYSTLLHLRQILDMSDEKAEDLEKDLQNAAYEFSI